MEWCIIKKDEVDHGSFASPGVWYEVVPKNLLIRFFRMFWPLYDIYIFSDFEKAKACAIMKTNGTYKYTKSKEVIDVIKKEVKP